MTWSRLDLANRATIEPLMAEVGATVQLEVTFWREPGRWIRRTGQCIDVVL